MRRLRLLTFIVFCCLVLSIRNSYSSADKILGIDELMKNVEIRYSASKTFKSEFKQIYIGRNFGEIMSGGEVYFKKPGMMKWIYKKPDKKIIASDGKNLWIYDMNDSQILLDKNFRKEKVPSSISFLWGGKMLLEVFSYKILNVEEGNGQRRYTVELLPKEDVPNVTKVHFVIDSESYLILETSLFDLFGNENRLIFRNPRLGKDINDSFFKFEPPKGVQIVEPPKISG